MLVLDSGGFSRLSERSPRALAFIEAFRADGMWPPMVPTVVLVESLRGHGSRDATANRFLKACITEEHVSTPLARRAAELRRTSRHGSAVDSLVVALAEPGGIVLTRDREDIEALASFTRGVCVELI